MNNLELTEVLAFAVKAIKTAILQCQGRAIKAVNQEQLSLYFGIGRFLSENTRSKKWGSGVLDTISKRLKQELPGLRGFGASNLKNMRLFYEAWKMIEANSPIAIGELAENQSVASTCKTNETSVSEIRQLQLANLPDFPLKEFLDIGFTHHIRILESAKELDERLFYIRYCAEYKPTVEELTDAIKQHDFFHHQGRLPNNFLTSMPDYKQAYRAIRLFKDEYLLDFINVEELGSHDEEIDERIIESNIVHNVKNFIMTFGRGFTFIGNQVHFDKLGRDHWIDLLFYNRDLRRTVVFELKSGNFKVAYLAQLSTYLRILNDDDRREGEEAPIGIILCKQADKTYVEYIMQDFRQPMGVATYRTTNELDPNLLKALPPKESLQRIVDESGKKRSTNN